MSYKNRNTKGQYAKRHGFTLLGFVFTVIILYSLFSMIYQRYLDGIVLVSPQAYIVTEAHAYDQVIGCESPTGYIVCKVYKEELTVKQAELLIAIAKAESGMNPNAINVNRNGTVDRGVFQINSIHKSLSNEDAFNFKKNIDFAIKMMQRQGFTPWVAYNTGAYKKFLLPLDQIINNLQK